MSENQVNLTSLYKKRVTVEIPAFFISSTVVTPGLLQKKCQKSVTVSGPSDFNSVIRRIFSKIWQKM